MLIISLGNFFNDEICVKKRATECPQISLSGELDKMCLFPLVLAMH